MSHYVTLDYCDACDINIHSNSDSSHQTGRGRHPNPQFARKSGTKMIFGPKDAAPLGFKPIDGGDSIDSSMDMRGLSLAIRPRARRPIALLKQDTSDHPITFPVTPDTPRCSTPGTESTELDLISPESPPKRRKMFHHHSPQYPGSHATLSVSLFHSDDPCSLPLLPLAPHLPAWNDIKEDLHVSFDNLHVCKGPRTTHRLYMRRPASSPLL